MATLAERILAIPNVIPQDRLLELASSEWGLSATFDWITNPRKLNPRLITTSINTVSLKKADDGYVCESGSYGRDETGSRILRNSPDLMRDGAAGPGCTSSPVYSAYIVRSGWL